MIIHNFIKRKDKYWIILMFAIIILALIPFFYNIQSNSSIANKLLDNNNLFKTESGYGMRNIILNHESRDGIKYNISASKASYVDKNEISLNNISGRIEDKVNGKGADFHSENGKIYSSKDLLVLEKEVGITTFDGYNIKTNLVNINLNTQDIYSDSPVEIIGEAGRLNANGFVITDKGNNLIFNNQPVLILKDDKINK